jgi:hypothetical protein
MISRALWLREEWYVVENADADAILASNAIMIHLFEPSTF